MVGEPYVSPYDIDEDGHVQGRYVRSAGKAAPIPLSILKPGKLSRHDAVPTRVCVFLQAPPAMTFGRHGSITCSPIRAASVNPCFKSKLREYVGIPSRAALPCLSP